MADDDFSGVIPIAATYNPDLASRVRKFRLKTRFASTHPKSGGRMVTFVREIDPLSLTAFPGRSESVMQRRTVRNMKKRCGEAVRSPAGVAARNIFAW
jgi:hypothetical protein